jgi:hypothetical protein
MCYIRLNMGVINPDLLHQPDTYLHVTSVHKLDLTASPKTESDLRPKYVVSGPYSVTVILLL